MGRGRWASAPQWAVDLAFDITRASPDVFRAAPTATAALPAFREARAQAVAAVWAATGKPPADLARFVRLAPRVPSARYPVALTIRLAQERYEAETGLAGPKWLALSPGTWDRVFALLDHAHDGCDLALIAGRGFVCAAHGVDLTPRQVEARP